MNQTFKDLITSGISSKDDLKITGGTVKARSSENAL